MYSKWWRVFVENGMHKGLKSIVAPNKHIVSFIYHWYVSCSCFNASDAKPAYSTYNIYVYIIINANTLDNIPSSTILYPCVKGIILMLMDEWESNQE